MARFVTREELTPPGQLKMEAGFRLVLEGLGLDLKSPHLRQTPMRAARAWYEELCRGLTGPEPSITTFPSKRRTMIVLQHVPIRSVCSHHLLPFFGEATIGYIPGRGQILGLSKLSRIANYWARRPQVQEELTAQIADDIARHVMGRARTGGVGVVIRAEHMCMTLRGVNHAGRMVTSEMRGIFLTSASVRAEFLNVSEDRR